MAVTNPAAEEGWVKSKDPKSGRVFYANKRTRTTQWDAPLNWNEAPPQEEEDVLPSNWQVLHDPSTGKPFYIDHERKITTWTRPTGVSVGAAASSSTESSSVNQASSRSLGSTTTTAPTSRSNAFQRILSSSAQQQQKEQKEKKEPAIMTKPAARAYTPSARSYESYNHSSIDVDFSDALPSLDFKVKTVPDVCRESCPHCDALFSLSKRRHHCRLCGDIFCDACSSHRVELPLEGKEFEAPVRICDFCNNDVDKGNFFSMRRYLTPLILSGTNTMESDDEEGGVATPAHVSAALCALTTDLDSCLQNASSFGEKMTIPAHVLVPAICRHLTSRQTSDYAIRALASLLAISSIVQDAIFAHAVYLYGGLDAQSDILTSLERSGSNRKTLFVQEQAARCMFYLSDSSILATLEGKQQELQSKQNDEEELGGLDCLDMDRTLRNMLDHSSVSKNPALQRWAAACIRNLVVEDERRACMAANDVAAAIASGETYDDEYAYTSFLEQLVSTGGIMILCTLVGADDADTRAHATGALAAVLKSTRAVDAALATLSEMTGSHKPPPKDGDVIRAIVAGGGCGSSISQLLLSADNAVASMGCEFISSLVMPLLEDARASATLASNYNCDYDNEGLGACREAALVIATGSCLPALLGLAQDAESASRVTRPVQLRKRAMETLAAVVMAVGQMSSCGADSNPRVSEAIASLTAEGVVSVALAIMESSSSQSLTSSRDNPALRIREAAGMILSSMSLCSPQALEELQSKGALSYVLAAASDRDMMKLSSLRGDAAPLCLGVVQTAALILTHAWENDPSSPQLLDRLLEAIDAGAISIMSRILFTKMDWESQDKSAGAMKAREACCRMLCAMFGIARNDDTGIGQVRLYNAVDAAAYSGRPPRNVITATLGTLQTSASYARRAMMGGGIQTLHYHAALMDLVEASLLAAGSMCGSPMAPGDADFDEMKANPASDDDFKPRRQEACSVACDVLVHRGRQGPLLPTMLVGGFGEATVNASLRLALTIAEHGSQEQHAKLAMSGVLVPIGDSLKNALSTGDLYKFSASLALVRFCGPHVAAGEGGGLQSVQEAIRVATNVLTLPVDPNADISQVEVQETLKSECISTLEALSKNASLWSAISKDALPAIVGYLHSTCIVRLESSCRHDTRVVALKAVLRLVQLPSHAVAASQAGIVEPLAKLMKEASNSPMNGPPSDDDIPMLALEIMHVLVSNGEARRYAQLLSSGVFQSICRALGNAATSKPNKPSDSRADICFWGLEILHFALLDVENGGDFAEILQSSVVNDIVDTVSQESKFLNALSSTLLVRTGMKLPSIDDDDSDGYEIPRLFGPPLVLVKESCAGFEDTHCTALSLLFSLAVYACAIDTNSSESFWNMLLLLNQDAKDDAEDGSRLAATVCAEFLTLLDDNGERSIAPTSERGRADFEAIARPLVRHRLLTGLKLGLEEQSSDSVVPGMSNNDPYICSLLATYEIPQICLSLWRDPALIDVSYELIKLMVEEYHDDVLSLFVQSKATISALFDMLTFDSSDETFDVNLEDFRRLVASILGSLAQEGMLTESVDRFDVRSSAIAALAAACLAENEVTVDEDGEALATSSRMSSRCMQCLVELCTVETEDALHHRKMTLSAGEAEAITRSLGKKICQMVTSRFLERAKLEQYDVASDDDIMDAPDVAMLCAVAQHESSLQILRSIGGLHALCLIASEGELSAIKALHQASIEDPSLVLDVEGHKCLLSLFGEESRASRSHLPELNREIDTASFRVLAQLCSRSKGRSIVTKSDAFEECLMNAMKVESSMIESPPECPEAVERGSEDAPEEGAPTATVATDDDEDDKKDDTAAEHDDMEKVDEATEPNISDMKPPSFDVAVSDAPVAMTVRSQEDVSLEVAAYDFLSSLVPTENCRAVMLHDSTFMHACLLLAEHSSSFELMAKATAFLVTATPYSRKQSDLPFSAIDLMEVFRETLHLDTLQMPKTANVDRVQSQAMEGAERLFDQISAPFQCSIISHASERFIRLVKSVTRPSKGEILSSNGGTLACTLALLMLRAVGNKDVQKLIFDNELLTSMIQLTQWRYDPILRSKEQEPLQWDAAVSQCLQVVAYAFCGTEETLQQLGLVPSTLVRSVLMISRPGKAPRKAIDFKSALRCIVDDGSNAVASMAAQRILNCLED